MLSPKLLDKSNVTVARPYCVCTHCCNLLQLYVYHWYSVPITVSQISANGQQQLHLSIASLCAALQVSRLVACAHQRPYTQHQLPEKDHDLCPSGQEDFDHLYITDCVAKSQ